MTRRQALASSSPTLLGLLGGLSLLAVGAAGIVVANVVDICRRRDEWPSL